LIHNRVSKKYVGRELDKNPSFYSLSCRAGDGDMELELAPVARKRGRPQQTQPSRQAATVNLVSSDDEGGMGPTPAAARRKTGAGRTQAPFGSLAGTQQVAKGWGTLK
jgi:hypothetical protein